MFDRILVSPLFDTVHNCKMHSKEKRMCVGWMDVGRLLWKGALEFFSASLSATCLSVVPVSDISQSASGLPATCS